MSRYIDADAHVARMRELYCKDCSRRKGMKNGKMKFIYPIGGVPCRACEFGDALDAIDDAPTVDAVPVVRCRECKHNIGEKVWLDGDITIDCANGIGYPPPDWFCADGERRTNEQQT